MHRIHDLLKKGAIVACTLTMCVLVSCTQPSVLCANANVAQTLLGRPARESVDVMGLPIATLGSAKSGKALWGKTRDYRVPHYVPSRSYSSTSYSPYSDTYTVTTTTTPGYTYYTYDFIGYVVKMQFLNDKIVSVDYKTHNYDMAAYRPWKKQNLNILTWNSYAANDKLKDLKEIEAAVPQLASPEMRLKGCLQAAKFDAIDVLVYYLRDCQVPLDVKHETWAYGENCRRNPMGDDDSLVLTEATVREIITAKNTPKVVKKLQKLGLL